MNSIRKIETILKGKHTVDGAGVRLHRMFGFNDTDQTDPFLLLDNFGSDNPDDYLAGFPWHPHRGIETVTYMIHGEVEHRDSLGNAGVISSGDIQWMTAGSGIIHQEMPQRAPDTLSGFQLWVNLPSPKKMMAPRYRGITREEVPETILDNATVKVIAGTFNDVSGPVKDLVVDVEYLDIALPPQSTFTHAIKKGYRVFVMVFEGQAYCGPTESPIHKGNCVIFDQSAGDVRITTKNESVRFLLVSGEPLGEPISWCGPIVMNTQEECEQAFEEYEQGTFIKVKQPMGI